MALTAWVDVADTSLYPGKPGTYPLFSQINKNIIHVREWMGKSYFAGAAEDHNHDGVNSAKVSVAINLMPNGSFENLSGAVAAGWTNTPYTGGTIAISTSQNIHGNNCLAIISTGTANGGGNSIPDEFRPVAELRYYEVEIYRHASVANVPAKVVVEWYTTDSAGSKISETFVINDADTPLTATAYVGGTIQAPSTARYARTKVEHPSGGGAIGTVYFDGGFMREAASKASIMPETFEDHVTGSYDVAPRLSSATSHGNSWARFGEWYMDRDGTIKTELGLRRGDAKASGTGYIRIYKNGSAYGTQRSTTSTTTVYWEQDLAFVKGDKIQVYVKENYSVGSANFSCGLFSGKQYARMGAHKDYPVGAI